MKLPLDIRRFSIGRGLCTQKLLSIFIATLLVMSAFLSGCSDKKKNSTTPVVVTTPKTTTPKTTTPKTTTPKTAPKITTPTTKPVTTDLESEEPVVGDVMITFSTTNDLMAHYPSFKLGLYDIVAYVRTSDNLHKVSLYDLQPVSTTDYSSVVPLELSHLKAGSHLYHGMFKAPAGKLESLSIQVIGALSNVAIGNDGPSLIDAFFSSYTPGDARVPARVFPAEVMTGVAGDIMITDKKLTMVNIAVDMNLTASMEPLRHVDPTRTYALFTPSIEVTEKTGSLDMSIHQVDLVSMTESSMGMGDAEGIVLTMNYTKAEGVKTLVNGDEASFADVAGLHAADMTGVFSTSADGHSFEMKHGSLAALIEANTASIYQGKVSIADDTVTILGTQQMLATDEISMMGTLFFEGELAAAKASALGIKDGDMVAIWSDGTSAKLLSMPAPEVEVTETTEVETTEEAPEATVNKLAFDLHATVSYTPADILSIGTSVSTDEAMTLTLSENLECAHYVKDVTAGGMASCDSALTTIEFTKSIEGMYTLHETRQGTLEDVIVEVDTEANTETETDTETGTEAEENTEEGEDVVAETDVEPEVIRELTLEADTVHHFTNAADFVAALEARVKTDKYRLATFTAEGTVEGTTFKVGAMAKAVILQPHEILDNDNDGWILGLLSDEVADPLSSDKDKNIGLYAGLGVAGVLAVGAVGVLVKYLYERKKRFSFEKKIVVKMVDAVSGGMSWMTINGRPEACIYLKGGKTLNVELDENGSIVERDTKKRVMDFNGMLAEGVTAKYVAVAPSAGETPMIFDQDRSRLKLFSVDESGNVKEKILTVSADNEVEFDDGEEKVKLAGNLNDSVGAGGKKYLLATTLEQAQAKKMKAVDLGEMFLKAAESGLLASEPYERPTGNRVFNISKDGTDADVDITETKRRPIDSLFYVSNVATPSSAFEDEFTVRTGDFKHAIKPDITSVYHPDPLRTMVKVHGNDFSIDTVKVTQDNKMVEITADNMKKGAIEIRNNQLFITQFELGPFKRKKHVGTFAGDGSFIPRTGFTDIDIMHEGSSIKDSLSKEIASEMKRTQGLNAEAFKAFKDGGKLNKSGLGTFKFTFSKLGFQSEKTPYMNSVAENQKQSVIEKIRQAGSSMKATISESWQTLRRRTGTKTGKGSS